MTQFGYESVTEGTGLSLVRLPAADVSAGLFDCLHGAEGDDLSRTTPAIFRERIARVVRVAVTGIEGTR